MSRVDLGFLAGVLTTAAWLPQIYRNWRLGSAAQISWGYLATFGLGISLWLSYGVLEHDSAITAANAATLALVVFLVVLKVRTRARRGLT